MASTSQQIERYQRPTSASDASPAPPRRYKRIYVGEVAAYAEPVVLQTLLGSCVAVCLRDPVSSIAGMNHILLPHGSHQDQATRFGVQAMELLINLLMRLGGDRRRLVAKAFGAANVLPGHPAPTVGDQNAAFVRDFLSCERMPLIAQRLGGIHAVQVHFRTDTGKALVHSVNGSKLPKIMKAEHRYSATHLKADAFSGKVTLFA